MRWRERDEVEGEDEVEEGEREAEPMREIRDGGG